MLEDTENWLYEEGEDQEKEIYQDKLSELKVGIFRAVKWITKKKFVCLFTVQINCVFIQAQKYSTHIYIYIFTNI